MAAREKAPKIDRNAVVNSVWMAMEKELRKFGITPEFHEHAEGNRRLIEGMVAIMIADHDARVKREAEEAKNESE